MWIVRSFFLAFFNFVPATVRPGIDFVRVKPAFVGHFFASGHDVSEIVVIKPQTPGVLYFRRAAAAMEGSEKWRVGAERMAVFDRRFGFHAERSSSTKILRRAAI